MEHLTVVDWIPCDYNDGKKEGVGSMGGFFEYGMRWKDYLARWEKRPESIPYLEAIRCDVLVKKLRLTGEQHQYSEAGCPLFSDGTVGRFSYRGWGDLMAAIWAEEENTDYCYLDFYC